MFRRTFVCLLGAGLMAGAVFADEPKGLPGENPHPVHLVRRPVAPALGQTATRVDKNATQTSQSAANIVPQGGLFWDGRADTLQMQAAGPLLDPREMDGGSIETIAEKLRNASYAKRFILLFGENIFQNPRLLVAEAMFAVGRIRSKSRAFIPTQASSITGWKARPASARPKCAGFVCSMTRKKPIAVCGPIRTDIKDQTQFCGMFKTPTLRNTAIRRAFFHNGVFGTLQQVMDFYNSRDTNPEKVYPRAADGTVQKYNDIPAQYHANVDVTDPPFNRHPGETPAMTAQDEADIIEFLKTLNDGYEPDKTVTPN